MIVFCAGLAGAVARQMNSQEMPKDTQAPAEQSKIPPEDAQRHNPIKPTPENLAQARRIYGYDCAMCHGKNGDGKGDLAADMKLELKDWRDPAALAGMTDGELFYLIKNGKGKMVPDGGRTKDTQLWELVNLLRSFAKKDAGERPKS